MNIRSIITSFLCAIGISAHAATPQPSLAEEVFAKAELAVSQLQKRAGGKLDYSEKSLVMIEEILEETSQYKDRLSKKDKDALVELIGSYILEVAHRKHGGKYLWHDKENQPVLVIGEPKYQSKQSINQRGQHRIIFSDHPISFFSKYQNPIST